MILHNSKHRSWRLILASVTVFALTEFWPTGQASAQTLNQAVDLLLSNSCTGLNPPFGGTDPGFGPDLNGLCFSAGNNPANSTGGGAASLQGSAASILNRVLLQRLNETDEEEGRHRRSSSLLLNPMGVLGTGLGGNLSVSSPFYASSTAGGGSAANFTTGNQSRWHGLGFFASGLVESLNRNITTFQDGYKSNILGITAGGIIASAKSSSPVSP